tara:strand:- start:969 stop:1373 length:405 start_codon:yes stop_codon:yes gene_type:complete
LARREHSVKELVRKLKQREFEQTEIEEALERLHTHRLQSDERFAEAYVRMRERAGFGPVKIRLGLTERGVSDHLIDAYLPTTLEDWQSSAQRVWQKKFHGKQPGTIEERAKQTRFMLQRGFAYEHIKGIGFDEQ